MRYFSKVILTLLVILISSQIFGGSNKNYKYVNPFIGTGGKGHTYPGATVPFGMVQLSPDIGTSGWDRISGYFYEDSTIGGFSHTHLSGTGIGDLYDIPFFPSLNDKYELEKFNHDNECAEPGYYSVVLDNGISVELTATKRVGFHKYSFPKKGDAIIFLDLLRQINWDCTVESKLEKMSDTKVQGYRYSKGWADDQRIYFAAEFSKPFKKSEIKSSKLNKPYKKTLGDKNGFFGKFSFDLDVDEKLFVKVAISPVSVEGAWNNMSTELSGWDFTTIRKEANLNWQKHLSKIDAEFFNEDDRIIFYTALYQSMLAPTIFSDVDGKYFGPDKKIHTAKGFENYCTFSLWDTFRATHPLFTILHPERVNDMVKAMLVFYEQNGLLPVWSLYGNETNCMSGYSAVPVIADALLKGIGDFDSQFALEACMASAMSDFRGVDHYRKLGYVPYDKEEWSVSKTLEYSFADWCIAEMATKLGEFEVAKEFYKRGDYYKNVYQKSSKFMVAKNKKGKWRSPFNPKNYEHDYTESNAWHYFWYTPQDIPGVIDLVGGKDKYIAKLDSFFTLYPEPEDKLPIFSTGMIGQYVHGNEPSHHVGYLYNYAGAPWKTQKIVREIIRTQHKNTPDGICGNEDCGQMSAWFVFSALGFYPVNPSSGVYVIGSPLIKNATINLENGNKFQIITHNNSDKNIYIESVKLNNMQLKQSFITHKDIMSGGVLEITMSDKPNKKWATESKYCPVK